MIPEIMLSVASLTNFGAIDNFFHDFYPKTEHILVKKTESKLLNMRVSGNDVTKVVNMDGTYTELQSANFALSSEKGMWVKINLTGEFPKLNSLTAKSDKADMSLKAAGKASKLKQISIATRSGDTFLDWEAESSPLNVTLHSLSGDMGLVLNNYVSQVALASRSGEIYLKWKAASKDATLNLDTSSGDVHVELENGIKSAAMQTKSGDIDLHLDSNWQVSGDISIVTKTGDIMIEIPKDLNVVLNVYTITGEIAPGKLLEQKIDQKHKVFVQQVAAKKPTVSLKIESKTGDVLVH